MSWAGTAMRQTSLPDRKNFDGRARRIARRAVVWASSALLAGCAQKPPPPVSSAANPVGSINPPVVISSRPQQDTAAYQESQDQLSAADWQELEKLGPRPVWEQLAAKKANHRTCRKPPEASAAVAKPAPVTTRPALDESQLPLEATDLPDGKVRLIWMLQNFGGPAVKAGREATTNFRTVQLAQPDLNPLVAVLTQSLNGTGGSVTPLPERNAVIITCTKAMRPLVLTLLNDLDRPARQVEITAKIFEVSHDFDFQQGTQLVLNRLASNASQNLTSTFSARRFLDAINTASPSPVQGSVLHLMQAFESAGVSVDVSFQLLAEAGLIQIVSEPRMTVAVGQTGYMQAGQEIPIQSTNIANNAVVLSATVLPPVFGPLTISWRVSDVSSSVSGTMWPPVARRCFSSSGWRAAVSARRPSAIAGETQS